MKRTLALAITAIAVVGLCQAQIPGPSEPGLPPEKYEGQLVDSLLVPAWALRRDLPVRVGKPLTDQDLRATERILREDLEKQGESAFSVRKTLDVTLLRPLVLPSSKPNSVHVLFEVNRIVLTEDDTPGRALDESSTWTGLQSKVPDISFDFHRDQRLGLTLGTGLSTPRYFFKSGVSLKFYWDGWISSSDGFYDMKAGFDLVPGIGFQAARLSCGPEYDLSGLPFAGGELRNISFTAGCGYRFRSSNLESWRANATYRLGFQRLTFPGVAVRRYTDHGFEADINREYIFGPGFVRLQPWIDGAHSDEVQLNIRAGGRVRAYREFSIGSHSLFIADLGLNAGASLFGRYLPTARLLGDRG